MFTGGYFSGYASGFIAEMTVVGWLLSELNYVQTVNILPRHKQTLHQS